MKYPDDFIDKLVCGDCIEVMKFIPDNMIDAIVTDSPYGLEFMGKSWDKFTGSDSGIMAKPTSVYHEKGFNKLPIFRGMDDRQRNSFYLFVFSWATECLRILKPGGHLLSFGGSRTYHRMACAIEDAGFEIRNQIMWIYGSGFPKSLSISKAIDKNKGSYIKGQISPNSRNSGESPSGCYSKGVQIKTLPNTQFPEAKEWDGWGTDLKPAHEPIVMARKPLSEKTVAENVLKWGTGGINIDGCRIKTNPEVDDMLRETTRGKRSSKTWEDGSGFKNENNKLTGVRSEGRFPANIIFDEEAGRMLDEQSGHLKSGSNCVRTKEGKFLGHKMGHMGEVIPTYGDMGGASRFFYCAKASKNERNLGCEGLPDKNIEIQQPHNSKNLEERYTMTSKNNHPTVKPIKLMEFLCKLITPPKGIVLDPFAGSGSTLIAARNQGFRYIGIEKDAGYCEIAKRRLSQGVLL